MINIRQGDAISNARECADDGNRTVLVHGCNVEGIMGAGFAKQVVARMPNACATYFMAHNREGGQCFAGKDHATDLTVIHLITQTLDEPQSGRFKIGWFTGGLQSLAYELTKDADSLGDAHLHMPRIGAGLGGGDWFTIERNILVISKMLKVPITIWVL